MENLVMDGQTPIPEEEAVRQKVWKYLDVGLITEVEPRVETQEECDAILARLKAFPYDIIQKMIISGFYEAPFEHGGMDQSCETCIYFQVHRRYCDLPEIDLPVEAHWSCRLWRI
jgi:hypothetical protein